MVDSGRSWKSLSQTMAKPWWIFNNYLFTNIFAVTTTLPLSPQRRGCSLSGIWYKNNQIQQTSRVLTRTHENHGIWPCLCNSLWNCPSLPLSLLKKPPSLSNTIGAVRNEWFLFPEWCFDVFCFLEVFSSRKLSAPTRFAVLPSRNCIFLFQVYVPTLWWFFIAWCVVIFIGSRNDIHSSIFSSPRRMASLLSSWFWTSHSQ